MVNLRNKSVFLYTGILYGLVIFSSVSFAQQNEDEPLQSDNRTKLAANVIYNLRKLNNRTLFGHQDALAYGIGWKDIIGDGDVKRLIGQHPAVAGWELGNLELDSSSNLDEVSFDKMRGYIKAVYDMGGINTISWHANNPLNGKTAWEVTPGTVASILQGGIKHDLFVKRLDKIADFLISLKTSEGDPIPILFRPWHELTGNWFWWCQNVCTVEEFKSLWRFTYEHLVIKRRVRHLIWVYNTAEFTDGKHFLERLPDSGMVDILSFDTYQHSNSISNGVNSFVRNTDHMFYILDSVGKVLNKPIALAETGFETIPKSDWWTNDLLPLIHRYKPAYVLCWRNAGLRKGTDKMHYYIPYKGDTSAENFKVFAKDSRIIFQKEIKRMKIYKY